MKKKKTALRQLRDLIAAQATLDKAELLERIDSLFEEEKGQITAAWMQGNKEGWDMNTDWPEDAVKYYEQKYQSNEQ